MQRSLGTKVIAALTSVAIVTVGCTNEAGPSQDRTVSVEVVNNTPDQSGVRSPLPMGASTLDLDSYTSWNRMMIVDGIAATTNLASIKSGSTFVVPLNNGETATFTRAGNRIELVRFTGSQSTNDSVPRGAVHAVELRGSGYDIYLTGAPGDAPDTFVNISGSSAERDQVIAALALDSLLVSLEDGEQVVWWVVMAIIAGIVGAVWWWSCRDFAQQCAQACQWRSGVSVTCGNLEVSVNPTFVHANPGYSCHCN